MDFVVKIYSRSHYIQTGRVQVNGVDRISLFLPLDSSTSEERAKAFLSTFPLFHAMLWYAIIHFLSDTKI